MRERAFFTLFRRLVHLVFKIFKKEKLHIYQMYLIEQFEIFHEQMHTYFKKQVIFDQKVFKMQRYSSVAFHDSPKTPNSEWSKKVTFRKIQILPQNSFPEWFGPKTSEPISFWKSCRKNQLKLIIPKKCGFWSRKGSNIWTLFKIHVRKFIITNMYPTHHSHLLFSKNTLFHLDIFLYEFLCLVNWNRCFQYIELCKK